MVINSKKSQTIKSIIMKKLISLLLIFFSGNICFSQDIIFKKNKAFIQAKILDSNANEIIYKQYFNQNGPTYIIFKADLLKILYESGKLENYKDFVAPIVQNTETAIEKQYIDSLNDVNKSNSQNIESNSFDESLTSNWGDKIVINKPNGELDAEKHYDGYHKAGTVTFLVSAVPFYGIIWGLAPTIICSAIPPAQENLNYPNEKLMKNPTYKKAYNKKAYQIKKRKILKNYGYGILSGTGAAVAFLLYVIITYFP
jgi:hypothetical protein